jgi:hypothetical protein
VVLFVLALVVIGGLGGMVYYLKSGRLQDKRNQARLENEIQKLKDDEARHELARKKGEEDAKLTLARNRQDDVLQVVRKSTNVLGNLIVAVGALNQAMDAIKTNSDGRIISPHPDLVAQARRLYEDQGRRVPLVTEVAERLEGVRRIEQQLLSVLGTAFNPEATLTSSAQDALVWAQSQARSVYEIKAALGALQRDAKAKLSSAANPPMLQDAMMQQTAAEEQARNAIIIKATENAKWTEAQTLAAAQSNHIIAQAHAKLTDAEIERQHVLDDSQRKLLREKASRTDIQSQLAAYLTPGYFLPPPRGAMGIQKSYDKKPMSYSKLRELGALEPTMDGLHKFVAIGVHRGNDRPRLAEEFLGQSWDRKTELLEQAKGIQQLMIELGPTWVETGVMEK